MENSRTKNTLRNSFFGIVEKIVSVILPFIIRTIIINILGEQYSGLNSLFSSILTVLNFTELGIGSAIVFCLYKPVAENDTDHINSILKFYRKVCYIIGMIILISGLITLPFLRYLIDGDIPPDINIYILFLISLSNSVVSYFLFAYQTSIFYAEQRIDILNKINSIVNILCYTIQILVIIFFKNYYIYALILPFATVLINLLRYIIFKKKYPYKCKGDMDNNEKKILWSKVRALIGFKISATIIIAADNIVISSFLGLVILSRYNNYYYIINMLSGFLLVIFDSFRSSVGNYSVNHTKKEAFELFKKIDFILSWIVIWICSCLISIYQPFIIVWLDEEKILSFSIVLLLSLEFYIWKKSDIVTLYRDSLGLWSNIKIIPYLGAIINIGLNLLLTYYIGLPGIIISTIICFAFMFPFEIHNVFKNYFEQSERKYYFNFFIFSIILIISCLLNYFIYRYLHLQNKYLTLFVVTFVSILLPNIVLLLASLIFYKDEVVYFKQKIRNALMRFLKK